MYDPAFEEDLSKMSVFKLMCWLAERIVSVYRFAPGGNRILEIDENAVQELYDNFFWLINLTSWEAESRGDIGPQLLKNKKVILSEDYKKAVVALHRPLPQVFLNVGKKKPENITRALYKQPIEYVDALIDKELRKGVEEYMTQIDHLLQRSGMDYRQKVREFISERKTQQRHCNYTKPKDIDWFDGRNMDAIIEHLANANAKIKPLKSSGPYAMAPYPELQEEAWSRDKTRFTDIFKKPYVLAQLAEMGAEEIIAQGEEGLIDDEGLMLGTFKMFGGLQELGNFYISPAMNGRYGNGAPVDKIFFARLAFFLGLDVKCFEALLQKEGFSALGSIRPSDIILQSSFLIGFPFEFADKLLLRQAEEEQRKDYRGCKGSKGIGAKPKKEGSPEA